MNLHILPFFGRSVSRLIANSHTFPYILFFSFLSFIQFSRVYTIANKQTVVELACGEYGNDKIKKMVDSMTNGECIDWFKNPNKVLKLETLRRKYPLKQTSRDNGSLESTTPYHQLQILMRRGWLKTKRDATLTHLR